LLLQPVQPVLQQEPVLLRPPVQRLQPVLLRLLQELQPVLPLLERAPEQLVRPGPEPVLLSCRMR
jgi:hypothetical protein